MGSGKKIKLKLRKFQFATSNSLTSSRLIIVWVHECTREIFDSNPVVYYFSSKITPLHKYDGNKDDDVDRLISLVAYPNLRAKV